jgi:hypothetical protein
MLMQFFARLAYSLQPMNLASIWVLIKGNRVLFLHQVDVFSIACSDKSTAKSLLELLDDELTIPMKHMGLLDLYNGLDVIHMRDFIKINCSTYIEKILEKHLSSWMKSFDVPAGRPTPLPSRESYIKTFLSATGDPDPTAQTRLSSSMGFGYQSGIGELINALVTCCPDISSAVVRCAQNSVCPAENHYHAIKHILKYLYLTKDDSQHYWHTSPNDCLPATDPLSINSTGHNLLLDGRPIHDALNLHGFVDSDWATCPKTHCSFTGVCVCLSGGTIAYKSKIQPTVAQSSTEAEFMGASDFGQLILFIRSVLWDIGVPQAAASILYEDNNACIAMAMAQKPTPRMRHMDIKFHAPVKWVKRDLFCLECINTSLNMTNHFTKQLGHTLFHRHINYLLVGQGRYSVLISSTLKILITLYTDPPGQF